MRKLLASAAWLLVLVPSLAFGQQGILGSKPSPVTAPSGAASPGIGLWDVLQIFVALAIVAALLKWGLPWIMKKAAATRIGKGSIQVRESALMGSCHVHLLEVQGRTLLVATGPQSASLLADLTDGPVGSPAPAPSASVAESQAPEERMFLDELDDQMDSVPVTPAPRKRSSASAKAVIQAPLASSTESGSDMSMDEAVALIAGAKRRTGMEAPAPAKTPKAAPRKKEAAPAGPSDDDILAALDRIARLSR